MPDAFSAFQIARAYGSSRFLRSYIATKMTTDPVYKISWKFISMRQKPVWDIGCGFGLLGISMRGAGLTERYRGFDTRAWKVNKGMDAMRHFGFEDIGFEVRETLSAKIPEGATVCMFDVLHSLPPPEQNAMLERLASAAESGSLILLRTTFKDSGGRYLMTYLAEFYARLIRWTRAGDLNFPSKRDLVSFFKRRGLGIAVTPIPGKTPFLGELVVIEKIEE
jgi:2-polyprenyl-3-methyl-5-hydroxy-6-metoxy-1,4-benzoquinol methylase